MSGMTENILEETCLPGLSERGWNVLHGLDLESAYRKVAGSF